MDPLTAISLIILGLVVGVLVGLTSVGSGALMTPILLLDFSSVLTKTLVVGTSTTQGTISKMIASIRNYRQKALQLKYVFLTAITGVPLAAIGAFYSKSLVSSTLFSPFLAAVLLIVGILMISNLRLKHSFAAKDPEMTTLLRIKGMVVGAIVGLIAGLTGVSTGSVLVSSLIMLLKFPSKTAVGLAVFEGSLILLAATVAQLYLGNVSLAFTAFLLVGAIPGILIGSHYKDKIDGRKLGYLIASVIILEAAQTLSNFFFPHAFFIF